MSCQIPSVALYLCENEAENLQNGDVHFVQIPDFRMGYLKNHWRIEVSDVSRFGIFHALSFELKLFFDRSFPLNVRKIISANHTGHSIEHN